MTDAPYECPTAPRLPQNFQTNSYYVDTQHSIPDPALVKKHQDSVAGIEEFSHAVVRAADGYRTKGSRRAAQCVLTLLDQAQKQRALTGRMNGH